MDLDMIKQDIISIGGNPDDFNISISEHGYSVSPKWFYENKQIAKEEDEPIIADVNVTAETIVYTTQDVMMLADTIMHLMSRVIELEGKLNG